jgi:hypothetical protein
MCAERAVAYFKDQVRILLSDTVILVELSFLHVALYAYKSQILQAVVLTL